jgi:hypothetical protein
MEALDLAGIGHGVLRRVLHDLAQSPRSGL